MEKNSLGQQWWATRDAKEAETSRKFDKWFLDMQKNLKYHVNNHFTTDSIFSAFLPVMYREKKYVVQIQYWLEKEGLALEPWDTGLYGDLIALNIGPKPHA